MEREIGVSKGGCGTRPKNYWGGMAAGAVGRRWLGLFVGGSAVGWGLALRVSAAVERV